MYSTTITAARMVYDQPPHDVLMNNKNAINYILYTYYTWVYIYI